ncbi:ileal sodium/bile acid cotransporter-like [Amphiura filiformis]|uniref:ileal sodium/bile acid cotransporter-like n=1 Tax=Amphiura filiformis TaxID=82378 RepID=UPI003B2245DA
MMYLFVFLLGVVTLLPHPSIATETTNDLTPSFNFTLSGSKENAIYLLDNEIRAINLTIVASKPGTLRLESQDRAVFIIVNQSVFDILPDAKFPLTVEVILKGKFLGIVDLELYLRDYYDGVTEQVGTYVIKVGKSNRALSDVFTYALLVWLCISYITMGTKMEVGLIWSKLRRPWAVLIGMGCQFFIMPALAFGIAKLFVLDDETSVGLILDGTCPGGWFSNIFSLLLDLDVVLSLTMTFMSTVLALGMMPLNLLIYATPYTDDNDSLDTPFVELFFQMLLLLVPVGFGMVVTWKFEKVKKILDFLAKPFAGVTLLIALAVGLPSSLHVFVSPWQIWIASAIFPVIGSLLGFIIAKIACIPTRQAVTVALETGAQNSLMARTMIDLFYPLPEADLIGRVPTLISILTMLEGIVVIVIYEVWRRFIKKPDPEEKKGLTEEDGIDVTKVNLDMQEKNGHINGVDVGSVALEDPENNLKSDQNGNMNI